MDEAGGVKPWTVAMVVVLMMAVGWSEGVRRVNLCRLKFNKLFNQRKRYYKSVKSFNFWCTHKFMWHHHDVLVRFRFQNGLAKGIHIANGHGYEREINLIFCSLNLFAIFVY